jgi:hypothetical protein
MTLPGYDSWKLASPDDRGSMFDEAKARISQLEEALVEIIRLADEGADVDDGIPNLAMRILVEAEKAL